MIIKNEQATNMEVFSPAVVCSGGYLVACIWVNKKQNYGK